MTDTNLVSVTLESLRDLMQNSGYRVDLVSDPAANVSLLRSSTAGFGFDVRPGNRLAADENSFVDFTFSAWLNIEGELPLDVVNRWNALRRFGRLQVVPGFLALTMDVSLIGGVSPNNVRANVEIWDHLVQALVPYLREELQKLGTSQQTAVAPVAPDQVPAEAKVA
ncbi:YbjN domain-containing protein [Tardiphaga sp. 42S5]|uniref:YbjN domain-containing protein n=1 Tax=Tardiphaga sp. 42S5 TaxID=1404799 RepID=UPI002A5A751C|nr:YbjN domain-containing protein [Tardiphaga sp. 42S5]WPO40264.1 YbjN domain-containing protein [Tardiphaga sp. 42S5]